MENQTNYCPDQMYIHDLNEDEDEVSTASFQNPSLEITEMDCDISKLSLDRMWIVSMMNLIPELCLEF